MLNTIEFSSLEKEISFHGDFFSSYGNLDKAKGSNIRVINHEFVVSSSNLSVNEGICLKSNENFKESKYFLPIFSFYNNHSSDYKTTELRQTINNLSNKGCICLPSIELNENALIIHSKGNKKLGVLFICDPSTISIGRSERYRYIYEDWEEAENNVKELRKVADYIVVYVHWGQEFKSIPPSNIIQKAGTLTKYANMVVGHHAHIPMIRYKVNKKIVYFGLGNYIFDDITKYNNSSEHTKEWALFNKVSVNIYLPLNSLEEKQEMTGQGSWALRLYLFILVNIYRINKNLSRYINNKIRSLLFRIKVNVLN